MATKKIESAKELETKPEELEAVVLEDVITDVTDHELSVAEKFLAKEVRIANELGLNPKRKLHLAMVRTEVAKAIKEDI